MTPETLYKKIPARCRLSFYVSFATGVLTHLYMLTNKMTNWDDLTNFTRAGSTASAGRWFIPFVHPFGAAFSVPMINGIWMIFLAAVSCALIVRLLSFETNSAAVLFSLLFMTFPSFCSFMTFMFTVHNYGFALLFATLAVFFTCRTRYGWIGGIILMILSLAIYQAFLPYAAGLFLLVMLRAFFQTPDIKRAALNGLKYAGVMLCALVVYVPYSKSLISGEGYLGAEKMGEVSASDLRILIPRAYHRILQYFVTAPQAFQDGVSKTAHILLLVALALMLCYLVARKGLVRRPPELLFLFALLFLFPFACSMVFVMSPDTPAINMMMVFAYVLVYAAPVLLYDMILSAPIPETGKKIGRWTRGALLQATLTVFAALCVVLSFANYRIVNQAYFRTWLAFERTSALYNRIVMRVEETEGYDYDDRLLILGDFYPDPILLAKNDPKYGNRFTALDGLSNETGLFISGVRADFLYLYLGMNYTYASSEEILSLMQTDNYRAMPCYPADGCVKKIGDVWVVKMANNEELYQ